MAVENVITSINSSKFNPWQISSSAYPSGDIISTPTELAKKILNSEYFIIDKEIFDRVKKLNVIQHPDKQQSAQLANLANSEKIKIIRNKFGLRISDLAEIFSVSRQSVYNWINEDPMDETNFSKLDKIFSVAQDCPDYPGQIPNNLSRKKVYGNTSLLDELSSEVINLDTVKLILQSYTQTTQERRRSKMRENSIRDALRRHNMDDSPTQDGIDEIDLITGKIRD